MNDFYTGLMFLFMGLGLGSCHYLSGKNEADIEKFRIESSSKCKTETGDVNE